MANIIKPKRGSTVPTTANLVDGEIAVNTADKKLYSNIGGTVYELSPSTLTPPAGTNTQVQFNDSGAFGASSRFTFNSGTNALVVIGTIEATKLTLTTTTPTTSVGGCLEYDGKVLYGNAISGRGVIPVMEMASVSTTKSLNNATGDQDIFPDDNNLIQLGPNTTYIIRGYLLLNTGTTTARHLALKFTEGFTIYPPTIHFATIGTSTTSGGASRSQDTAFFSVTSGGNITNGTFSTNSYNVWITGVIKTVDSVTITPQIAFSAAPGGTNTVGFGSYIAFIPIGTDTVSSIGPWS